MSAAIDRDTADLMQRMTGVETAVENMEKKLDELAGEWREHDKADVGRHAELKADIAALDKRNDRQNGELEGKLDTLIARLDEREKARATWPGLGPALVAVPSQVWAWGFGVLAAVVSAWLATHGIEVEKPPIPLDVTPTQETP